MLHQFDVRIPKLTGREKRRAFVYVPDQQDQTRRYPVLYMFDGHNVFLDSTATYGKSWGMLEFLQENDVPLIVATVECNHHDEKDKCGGRLSEYSPFDFTDPQWGSIKGRGKITMDWMVEVFKPYIDSRFPTLPQKEYTFIGGSSMGGLMTLYALCCYNDTFSRGAALSPSLEFNPEKVREMIKKTAFPRNTVIYMDMGSREMRTYASKKLYGETTSLLIKKGVMLTSRVVVGGAHCEASWQQQIPYFMEVLFDKLKRF